VQQDVLFRAGGAANGQVALGELAGDVRGVAFGFDHATHGVQQPADFVLARVGDLHVEITVGYGIGHGDGLGDPQDDGPGDEHGEENAKDHRGQGHGDVDHVGKIGFLGHPGPLVGHGFIGGLGGLFGGGAHVLAQPIQGVGNLDKRIQAVLIDLGPGHDIGEQGPLLGRGHVGFHVPAGGNDSVQNTLGRIHPALVVLPEIIGFFDV